MPRAVVVGGGISSLYASTLLGERGYDVIVVERESEVGGLLNSVQNDDGDWFDQGTHFISGTNDPDIDRIILPESTTQNWRRFSTERAGNVFAGTYSPGCLFVDTRNLSNAQYKSGIADYLAVDRSATEATNLEDQLTQRFGEGFRESVFAPAMTKLFGVDSLSELTVDAHLLFGMRRIKAFTAEQTREYKQDPHHDDRLCFHEADAGSGARAQFYPHEGGAGVWIDALAAGAEAVGVELRTSTSVTDLVTDGTVATGVVLSSGERIDCDLLVWTVPLFPLLRSLDVEVTGQAPTLRHTTLLNFVFDRPPEAPDYYYFNYDPDDLGFRTTLYSNLQPDQAADSSRHRITVETLSSDPLMIDDAARRVEAELRTIGIVSDEARLLTHSGQHVREGFPVLNHGLAEAKQAQIAAATARLDNLLLAGRSASNAWFMSEVFADVRAKIDSLTSSDTKSDAATTVG